MKFKLTSGERHWVLYDVGNSVFSLLIATILPIYFHYLAEDRGGVSPVDSLAYWGYASAAATLFVALLGPALGAFFDQSNQAHRLFGCSVLIGAAGCLALGLVHDWFAFLIVFVLARIAYSISLIFYDAMLSRVTDESRMDSVSAQGFAWGYLGSCIPFVLCLGIVLFAEPLGLSMMTAMTLAFSVGALWWIIFSLPLLGKSSPLVWEKCHKIKKERNGLLETLKTIGKEKKIFFFLIAFFFYIDGVYTIIDMATVYGSALGLDQTGLLLAFLMTQIVAFPCSIAFGRLSHSFPAERLLSVCIAAYFGISVLGIFMTTQLHFWLLAAAVGMFQGGIQALSRSYFAKIVPAGHSGEFFGIYNIFGKGASFTGTAAMSAASQLTGNLGLGLLPIALFFAVGMGLFLVSTKKG